MRHHSFRKMQSNPFRMRLIFTLFIFFAVFSIASAQTRTVTGTVTSGEDGLPLPGVNVVVEGTTKGTVTDVDGNYSITLLEQETTLVFTFVGFLTKTVAVNQQSTVDVVLDSDTKLLE